MTQSETEIPGNIDDTWCLDDDTRHSVIARRNALAALWAGRLLGKTGEDLAAYAREVHRADFEVPGDSDIVAKLGADLRLVGHHLDSETIRKQLAKLLAQARRECASTD